MLLALGILVWGQPAQADPVCNVINACLGVGCDGNTFLKYEWRVYTCCDYDVSSIPYCYSFVRFNNRCC